MRPIAHDHDSDVAPPVHSASLTCLLTAMWRPLHGMLSALLRCMIHLIVRPLVTLGYHLRIEGLSNIPRHGGALLVCNHPSYMDPILLQASIGRFLRFMMYRPYYEKTWLKVPCQALRVIPIDGDDNPRAMLRSLRQVRRLIRSGQLVCVFAEGGVTRTGAMGRFKRGVEVIMKGLDAPIIPVGLQGVWGSFMSFTDGKLCFRLPFRRQVSLRIGTPIPASSRVGDIRQQVCSLIQDNLPQVMSGAQLDDGVGA